MEIKSGGSIENMRKIMRQQGEEIDLTEGRVLTVLIALALPIMGSSLLQFTYNLIDMIWVGKLGSNAVASIGSSSLFINIGNAINSLVTIGTGIKVSHAIGGKNEREVQEYINAGIIINIFLGVIFTIVLFFGGKTFIGFLDLNNYEVERDSYLYLVLNGPILFFSFFNIMYTRIMGSFGNNKHAFRINAVGVVLNIILDPLCIYVLKMGVMGAGISTLIANVVMFIMFRGSTGGVLRYKPNIKVEFSKIKKIIKLGSPMAVQRVLFTIINIFLAKIIAVFGSDAIAAHKVGGQIESVAYMVIGGFNNAVASFTGQNYGAKKYKRIKEGYHSALIVGLSYAFIISAVFLLFNKPLVRLFIKEGNTLEIAMSYLKVVAFSQVFSAIEMISNGLFTGIGKPKIPARISIVFTSLRIPLAWGLIKAFGINGVWISITATSILKGICSYLIYRKNINLLEIKDHNGSCRTDS